MKKIDLKQLKRESEYQARQYAWAYAIIILLLAGIVTYVGVYCAGLSGAAYLIVPLVMAGLGLAIYLIKYLDGAP